jgi:hypothetical protein
MPKSISKIVNFVVNTHLFSNRNFIFIYINGFELCNLYKRRKRWWQFNQTAEITLKNETSRQIIIIF